MKRNNTLAFLAAMLTGTFTFGQGFIEPLPAGDISTLFNKECIAKLVTGEEIHGKFAGGTLLNNYLTNVRIKLENGEKAKFKPDQLESLRIKPSGLAKMSMMAESASSIKELTHADFNEIKTREYIVFETGLKASKKDKARLLQLLNPGFDDKIKVYADPEANKTGGIGVGGLQLTGGEDRSYLFIRQQDAKAVKVKKGNYKRNFDELYETCPKMVEAFQGERIKWADVAGHVFAYNTICE